MTDPTHPAPPLTIGALPTVSPDVASPIMDTVTPERLARIGALAIEAAIRVRALNHHQQLVMMKRAGADGIPDLMTQAARSQDRCRQAVDLVLPAVLEAPTRGRSEPQPEPVSSTDPVRPRVSPRTSVSHVMGDDDDGDPD